MHSFIKKEDDIARRTIVSFIFAFIFVLSITFGQVPTKAEEYLTNCSYTHEEIRIESIEKPIYIREYEPEPETPVQKEQSKVTKKENTVSAVKNKHKNKVSIVHVTPTEVNTKRSIPLDNNLKSYIVSYSKQKGVNPSIIFSIIKHESGFKASAVSIGGGCVGLMQLSPRWNRDRMERLNCTNLYDPYQNVTVGIDLFASLCRKGKGVEWALMSYNGGSAYANRKLKKGEISYYASSIIKDSAYY